LMPFSALKKHDKVCIRVNESMNHMMLTALQFACTMHQGGQSINGQLSVKG
jgi:hypothetical protein